MPLFTPDQWLIVGLVFLLGRLREEIDDLDADDIDSGNFGLPEG